MNLAERYPPTLALAQAYSEHAPVMTMVPWYSRGIAYAKRSLAIRAELEDLWGQGQSLAFYGVVLYAASRYRESIDACREAIRLLQRTGDRWEENTATWHLAFAHYRLGALETAAELSRQLYATAIAIGDSAAAGISLSGWSRATAGDVPAELTRAGLDRHVEDAHTETEIHVAEAVRLLAGGRVDDAVSVLGAAAGIVRRAGLRQEYVAPVRPWMATALRLRAESLPVHAVAERRRALREAARACRRAVRIARRYRNNGPHAVREQALVASLSGRPRRARHLFAHSIELADRQGAHYERALTQQARGGVGMHLGWPGAAQDLEEAEAGVASLLPGPDSGGRLRGEGEPGTLSLSDRFEGLLSAGRSIASAPSEKAVLSAVRDAALTLLRGERCHVVAVGDTLVDDPATVSSDALGDVSRSLVTRAVREGVPVVASEGSPDVTESMVFSGVRSALCAPIRREGRTVACFSVTHRQVSGLFGDEEVRLAEFVATLAGAALEHVAGSEARYRSLALNSTDVVTIVDTDGVVSYQSSSVTRVFGFDPSELVGRPLVSWLHADDVPGVLTLLDTAAPGTDGSARVECRLRHQNGTWRHVETVATNLFHDPGIRGLVLNTRDVTERVALEAELRDQAWHDSLTGLANRALFAGRVTRAIARQSRTAGPLAVLFLDLDDFKTLNDTMGHAAGDLLLLGVGRRLESCVRPGDTVARFGGDEFALLLESADQATAEIVAQRVLAELAEPFPILGREVRVRASVGVAAVATEASVDELLGNADAAMYVAKTRGKDRYEVFEPQMRTAAVERSSLRTDLLFAVDRAELRLHYQPVVKVTSGRVVGFEALLRWQHAERGLLLPGEFIGLAEESGLIVPIGAWVTREACLQARAWNDARPAEDRLTMAVNLSVRQLQDADLVAMVSGVLDETGLDPSALVLEITESATVHDAEGTIARLEALKALGVGLAIDDFGTGYSPLSYLRHFPVDALKIDRSFVTGLGRNAQDDAIVSSVIGLAHAFGLEVVAEGVETVEQLEALTRFGCDHAQGYNWRRPASCEDADRWLESVVAGPTGSGAAMRVVVADDRESVRAALRLAMDVHGGFTVVGEAADGRQAVELATRHQPDLVVLDLAMPGCGGLEALPGIRSAAPRAGVVLLTAFEPADIPAHALDQTLALLDKTTGLDSLVDRLAEVANAR